MKTKTLFTISLFLFGAMTLQAQTEAEKARMREDKKLREATKKAYAVPDNKTSGSGSSATSTKSSSSSSTTSTNSSSSSSGLTYGESQKIMDGVFSERIAKEQAEAQRNARDKISNQKVALAKTYATEMYQLVKYMNTNGIQNKYKNKELIIKAAIANGIKSSDANFLFTPPDNFYGVKDYDDRTFGTIVNVQNVVDVEYKRDEEIAKKNEEQNRINFNKNEPNRFIELKADLVKLNIAIEPHNFSALRTAAAKHNFTALEIEEMFPNENWRWEYRIYSAELPYSAKFAALIKAEIDKKEAEKKAKLDAENEAYRREQAFVLFTENGLKGIKGKDGEIIIAANYNTIYIYQAKWDDLVTVWKKGKAGVVDLAQGKEIIAPQYENISTGGFGTIVAAKDGKYGLIDTANNILIPFEYDEVSHRSTFNNNGFILVAIRVNEGKYKNVRKYGFVDKKTAKVIVPIIYDDIHSTGEFKNKGRVSAVRNKVGYFIDEKGNETKQ